MPESIAGLAKGFSPLIAAAKAFLPHFKKVHAERRAARDPLAELAAIDPFERKFNDALARLGAIQSNQPWWKQVVLSLQVTYVSPGFFEITSIIDWLSQEDVQENFKRLARSQLLGSDADPDSWASLKNAYSQATGEHES